MFWMFYRSTHYTTMVPQMPLSQTIIHADANAVNNNGLFTMGNLCSPSIATCYKPWLVGIMLVTSLAAASTRLFPLRFYIQSHSFPSPPLHSRICTGASPGMRQANRQTGCECGPCSYYMDFFPAGKFHIERGKSILGRPLTLHYCRS
jgi:hypothetical protein